MIRADIPVMAKQLNLLAEVFDKKQISDGATLVWFDTLKEFQVEKVTGILIGWPKGHGKFPTPAEVWRVANDEAVKDREYKAAVERQQNKQDLQWGQSAAGEAALKRMKEILSRPKGNFRDHYIAMRDNPESSGFQRQFAKEALRNLGVREEVAVQDPPMTRIALPEERIPGADDHLGEHLADMANP